MSIKNLPFDEPFHLSQHISCRAGQVSSMGLTKPNSTCDMTVLAFSEGESVSEETYAADMMYMVVEGAMTVALPDRRETLDCGQAMVVSAGTPHAVEGPGAFKMLQIGVG